MAKASKARAEKSAPPKPSPPPARPVPGLGRGLTDIISQGARPSAPFPSAPVIPTTIIREIPLAQITPNPRQPRTRFIEEPLDELVASIREHGVLQPITVRQRGDRFEIIAGERRFRACQKTGLTAIPAIVKSATDAETLELALIENLQREDLDPIEEARGYRQLAETFAFTQEQIAQKIGKNRATIANALRLLDLPEEVQGYLSQGRLTTGHAKAILGLSSPDLQKRLAQEAIRRGWTVRQAEQHIGQQRPASASTGRRKPSPELSTHLQALQNALQQKLGTRVRVHPAGNGGRIEIQYYTATDLDRLLEILQIRL